jgi:hypothetical protein
MNPAEQGVTLAEHFRALADNFHHKARGANDPIHKAECERLAGCYVQLAERSNSSPQQFCKFDK